mgnify:CR=1 FL=1
MAGINLSQSIQEKQAYARGSFFDKGFFINAGIFLLVAGIYGGSVWYLGTVESERDMLKQGLTQKATDLKGGEANQVADLHLRLEAIEKGLQSNPSSNEALQELEQRTLQTISVTNYSWSQSEDSITIEGVTSNLKYLAQQMLAYKKLPRVISVHAETVEYNRAGQVEFELSLPLAPVVGGASPER